MTARRSHVDGTVVFARGTVVVMDPLEGRGGAETPEQEVADILPLDVDPAVARRVLGEVPFWFHTFALNRAKGIYTPGVAVDHRYRLPFCRRASPGCACSTWAPSTASMRSSPRRAARSGWWPSTASSMLSGFERAGALSRRAARASARSHACRFARRVPPSGGVKARRAGRDVRLRSCLGILHRVTDPLGLLRLLARASQTAAASYWRLRDQRRGWQQPLHPRTPTRRRLR